jgi:3-hydroxyisobutyrate dehydrogenase-like beta-hydroxyacid dehydrogenase/alkylhydroperoxidase/carboxymuconolactone decarboxylase family protein YurZ
MADDARSNRMNDVVENQNSTGAALTAGVVGLGMIGGGVAVNLVRAGITTTVFDVREGASERLEGVPAQVPTLAAVAQASDVVMVAVVNAEQARTALIGRDGLLTAGRDGLVVVLLSTVSLSAVKELAALCDEYGATLLDAGVTQAGDGLLVTMIGGSIEAVDRVRPVLDAFSKSVVHCGATGAGMVTKLARNVITYSTWAVVREAVSLAVAGGVDPSKLLEVIDGATGGPNPAQILRSQVTGEAMPSVEGINGLAQKDLAAAQEFATELRVQTPIVNVARPSMKATFEGDFGTPLPAEPDERGIATMNRVYGAIVGEMIADASTPAVKDMIEHLFGDIWSRAGITTRDRRLILFGSTAMIGRGDLLEVQLRGAIADGEFTTAQLREIELFLNYYAGIENGSAFVTALGKVLSTPAPALAPTKSR